MRVLLIGCSKKSTKMQTIFSERKEGNSQKRVITRRQAIPFVTADMTSFKTVCKTELSCCVYRAETFLLLLIMIVRVERHASCPSMDEIAYALKPNDQKSEEK